MLTTFAALRPQAKDLDMVLMDMNMQEAEPISREDKLANKDKKPRADMIYEVFPRHIADALKAGRKVEPETHEMVTVSKAFVWTYSRNT